MTRHFGSLATAGLLLAVSTAAVAQGPAPASFPYSSAESSPAETSDQISLASSGKTNVQYKSATQPRETISEQLSRPQADQAARPDITNMVSSRSQEAVATPSTAAPLGPRVDAARAGVVVTAEIPATAAIAPVAPAPRVGQNVALMIVGGAALITGAVIGGDGGTLLAIGGAVVGLIGLYQYVK